MLGILPDELKNDAERKPSKPHAKFVEPVEEPQVHEPAKVTEVLPEAEVIPVPAKVPQKDRNATLTEAQQFFEQGQYGRALALYSAMDDDANDGTHRYWMGMCWMKLKEYETAHKEFADFIAKYPTGVWTPRAKFNMAQIDYQLGYREKALGQMRKIIEDYPNEDAAQMARSSLQQMELNL
jgi:TolA-binding protein